jgi:hypothetical protein
VFRNNRIKQKTNWNSSKFVKISTFLILYTISSVFFGCVNTSLKHRNKTKQSGKIFWVLQKSKPKNNRNRLSFGLFRFKPRKKIFGLTFFGDFFSLLRENSVSSGCFDTGPKHRNKLKKCFLVLREKKRKTTETDCVLVCFGSNRKTNLIVSRTPYFQPLSNFLKKSQLANILKL